MFHPDLSYEIVRMRHGELLAAAQAASGRSRILDRLPARRRRRRSTPDTSRSAPDPNEPRRHLVPVPPPRPDRDHPSRDPRVA
jgi:hypothetical protein